MSSDKNLTCILITVKCMVTYISPDSLPTEPLLAEPWGKPSLPKGFPDSSVGKESAWTAGDAGSIPELGRSPGEGKGDPL